MLFVQIQAYAGFTYGAATMLSLHNMVVSYLLYKTRQTNVSNLLKIIFNFGNFIRFFAVWGYYMTPAVATMLQCTSLVYIQAIGNVAVRVSLTAFLLYRLRQVQNSKVDNWVSIMLFTIRAGLAVVQLGFQRPFTLYLPEQDLVVCDPGDKVARTFVLPAIIVEFIIDLYVTYRLVQVLRKANKNAASISSNITRKSRRTLFTAVIYWNFLRLFVAAVFHVIPLFNYYWQDDAEGEIITLTLLPLINIILSYVITVDAEIVRVIEGKNDKKGSSAGTEKSFSTSQSPRSPRGGRSSSDLPKYSQSMSSGKDTISQIDDDKIAVVSMKRLSFFEWANFVVGKRLRRNDEEQYEDENTEEIIDEPPKADKEDLEKGFPQDRRSSSFSGTTSVSTLDENPDIVIN